MKVVNAEVSELRAPVDTETAQSLKILRDILSQKLQRPASLSEVLAWAVKECREKHDPLKQAARARPSSGRVAVLKPGRHPIPQTVKHKVMLRDRRQCSYRGRLGQRCQETRFLDFHHIKPVAQGGMNTVENLRLLCHAHHDLQHVTNRS